MGKINGQWEELLLTPKIILEFFAALVHDHGKHRMIFVITLCMTLCIVIDSCITYVRKISHLVVF